MPFKLAKACCGGLTAGQTSASPQTKVTCLVGQANEVHNSPTCPLLDTGSMVSTIAESFVHKLKLDVKPLGDLIRVEGAGGHSIQYSGLC